MTDLYESDGSGEVFARGMPPQLPADTPVEAHLARHEAIIHTHHEEIASLRVGRHRLGNAVSRVEGQLAGMRREMRDEIEEVRTEVAGLRGELVGVRQDLGEVMDSTSALRGLARRGGLVSVILVVAANALAAWLMGH